MDVKPYPDCVPSFVAEYRALVGHLGPDPDDEDICALLMTDSEWSVLGSATLVMLARQYGTFVLANALALAEAMEIEDGEAGL
jgi:hypothetical protein